MSAATVCAVVLPPDGGEGGPGRTIAGLQRQTRPPEHTIVAGSRRGDFRNSLRTGLERGASWLWLLNGSAVPDASALEHLLEAAAGPNPPPAPPLLASRVLTPDGGLHPGSLPVPGASKRHLVLAALDRRLLALRGARRGSLLVHRRGFQAVGLPRPGPALHDDLEWTVRLLRHEPGLLAPASVVVRSVDDERPAARRTGAEVLSGLRLVAGGALDPRERAWFAYRLAEQALASRRPGRASRREGPAGRPGCPRGSAS